MYAVVNHCSSKRGPSVAALGNLADKDEEVRAKEVGGGLHIVIAQCHVTVTGKTRARTSATRETGGKPTGTAKTPCTKREGEEASGGPKAGTRSNKGECLSKRRAQALPERSLWSAKCYQAPHSRSAASERAVARAVKRRTPKSKRQGRGPKNG
jgi:hypothetical protein